MADTAITSDKQQQIITHAVLNSALKAVRLDSVNLIGYLQWSFVDGFEFVTQHTQGWGLVGLDWTTPKRRRYIKPFDIGSAILLNHVVSKIEISFVKVRYQSVEKLNLYNSNPTSFGQQPPLQLR